MSVVKRPCITAPASANVPIRPQEAERLSSAAIRSRMGKEGLEPSRPKAHDPKSCLSANSSTSPRGDYKPGGDERQCCVIQLGYNWVLMGRVINTDGIGRERKQLVQSVALAIRELMRQPAPDELTYDLAAYIVLALRQVSKTIDVSVAAWEKRGYWLKSDHFRMEWAWTEKMSDTMGKALLREEWGEVASCAAQIASRLNGTQVPKRNRLGTPWVGAWERLRGE